MTILVLIGMLFVIIREMFHGRISLDSVLLLLLVNFVSWFRLELMYIPLIESISSSLTYLSSESKVKFRQASNCCKSILEAAKLACANKTENFGELLTVFSTKVDLLYLLYSTVLGLLELWHLIYPRLLIQFGMLVFFTNLSLMEFQVRYLTVFLLF